MRPLCRRCSCVVPLLCPDRWLLRRQRPTATTRHEAPTPARSTTSRSLASSARSRPSSSRRRCRSRRPRARSLDQGPGQRATRIAPNSTVTVDYLGDQRQRPASSSTRAGTTTARRRRRRSRSTRSSTASEPGLAGRARRRPGADHRHSKDGFDPIGNGTTVKKGDSLIMVVDVDEGRATRSIDARPTSCPTLDATTRTAPDEVRRQDRHAADGRTARCPRRQEGTGPRVTADRHDHGPLPRPDLPRRRGVRRATSAQEAAQYPAREHDPGLAAGLVGQTVGSRVILVIPSRARVRRGRAAPGADHPAERRPDLRDRHLGMQAPRQLASDWAARSATRDGRDSEEVRAADEPDHLPAGRAHLHPEGPDPAGRRGLPRPHRRGVRPDVRPRQGRAARPRRPDRGRHASRRRSTTRSATGSGATGSSCPRSASRPTRPRSWAWRPGCGSTRGLASATTQGLRKLRAGGVDVDESALAILEPQLATDEPAFDGVFDAVTQRRPIELRRTASGSRPEPMHAAPRAVGDRLVARPLVRRRPRPRPRRRADVPGVADRRRGPSRSVRRAATSPPADLDLRALAESLAPPHPHSSATDPGAGRRRRLAAPAGRRVARRSTTSGPSSRCRTRAAQSLADELLSYGPDVVVIEPDEVRDDVDPPADGCSPTGCRVMTANAQRPGRADARAGAVPARARRHRRRRRRPRLRREAGADRQGPQGARGSAGSRTPSPAT